jgi:hypothetical protein
MILSCAQVLLHKICNKLVAETQTTQAAWSAYILLLGGLCCVPLVCDQDHL